MTNIMSVLQRERQEQAGGSTEAAEEVGKEAIHSQQAPVLRSYGQRRAKLDPVADKDAPKLSVDTLTILAGRQKH